MVPGETQMMNPRLSTHTGIHEIKMMAWQELKGKIRDFAFNDGFVAMTLVCEQLYEVRIPIECIEFEFSTFSDIMGKVVSVLRTESAYYMKIVGEE